MAESFDTWLGSLPKWLQTAAADLLHGSSVPDAAGIVALADLCIAEASGRAEGFSSVPAGAFDLPSEGARVRLKRIDALKGVNALDLKARLDFGDSDLVVVYGQNGTGKSGFAKLIKHASNARARTAILPNVFSDEVPDISADFLIERERADHAVCWCAANGPAPDLQHLHVFDAEVARFYMTQKAEATYEPRRLRFLTALVDVCDGVRDELQKRKGLLPSAMPVVPEAWKGTDLAKYIHDLNHRLSADAVQKRFARMPNHTERIGDLQRALQAPDPATRIAAIAKELTSIANVQQAAQKVEEALSRSVVAEVTQARSTAIRARRSASEVAAATLDQARFSGVGAEAWRAMWEAARIFSKAHAYPSHDFPHVQEALCPLCQQGLGDEAGKRMLSFEAFVTGDVEARARAAEERLRTLLGSLPTIPAREDWVARYSSIPGAEEPAKGVHAAFAACLEALGRALVPDEVPGADCRSLMAVLDAQRCTLESEQELLLTAQKGSERAKLEAELAHLRMLDWCNDNLPAILAELGRLKKVEALDAATRRTSTAPLTKKKNELAQAELTGGYQSRFEQELKALGGSRLPVKPMEAGKGAKGRVTFSLAIVGAKKSAAPVDVLSEGEARVVSLAAFLADVTVAGARTPFVFDDPISSLDIEFEERVADKLIALARTRQVLVFTHRLSLVALIREAIKKGNTAAKHVDGQTPVVHREVVLRRLGRRIGLATDAGIHESKVEKALNDVMNRRMAAAKKAEEAGDPDTYADLMQGICSDIRTLAERAVEEELLSGVVVRFRRSVVTKDKLTLLAKINVDDCTFIDDLMTRFSVFEHSQPSELPVAIPSYEDVMADAMALKNWVVEFRERVAEAVEA